MQTRRELLQEAIFLPMAAGTRTTLGQWRTTFEIVPEPNCLSEESAEGFRTLIQSGGVGGEIRKVIVLCGVSSVSRRRAFELREQAAEGALMVWESSPMMNGQAFERQKEILGEVFGIALRDRLAVSSDRLYVRYERPVTGLTRAFSRVVPVACERTEAIAQYGETPVAMKRRIGRGGIVYLGSMLGPNLRAEEREAAMIAARLLNFQE